MGTTVAIVSILLALVAAGCIGYIAWELTSEDNHPSEPGDDPTTRRK
jgi:hypothetical protein